MILLQETLPAGILAVLEQVNALATKPAPDVSRLLLWLLPA